MLVIIEFLKLVLGIASDGLQLDRLTEMLLRPNTGIAVVVSDERYATVYRSKLMMDDDASGRKQ